MRRSRSRQILSRIPGLKIGYAVADMIKYRKEQKQRLKLLEEYKRLIEKEEKELKSNTPKP
jgi:hypothetical protein